MKNNFKCFAFGLLAFAGIALTSCSSDDVYDVQGNPNDLIYISHFADKVTKCQIYNTPGGVFGTIAASLPVKVQRPLTDSLSVTATVDTTLVSTYNAAHGTTYSQFPAEVLSHLLIASGGISAGEYAGNTPVKISLSNEYCGSLTDSAYLLPFRLTGSSSSVKSSEDQGIGYIIVVNKSDYLYPTTNTVVNSAIVSTPVGIFGGINASFGIGVRQAANVDIKINAEVDNSLIETYNSAKGTTYASLPDNVVNALNITSAVIKSGETSSSTMLTVTDPSGAAKNLTGKGYLLPIRLTAVYPNGQKQSYDNNIAYVVITLTNKLIHANTGRSDISGTEIAVANMQSWTSTGGNISDVSDNDSYSGWDFDSSTPITIDMKAVKNIGGISLQSMYANYSVSYYGLNTCKLELSEDGSAWTDCGTAAYSEMSTDGNGYQYVALYGNVNARYVRITLSGRSSYYSTLAEFRVFAK